MANSLLTISMITREALRLFRNDYPFLRMVDTQYDDQFAKSGAKIGNTLNIRLPVDYTVGFGPTITPQNTVENKTSLSITNQFNVPMSFSSVDMALSLDDFSRRIIRPAVNNLAGQVAATLMSTVDNSSMGGQGPAGQFVHATDSNGNTVAPTASTVLFADAILTQNSAPSGNGQRVALISPQTNARLVSALSGLFNPQAKIGEQYETGLMAKDTLGFDFYRENTIQTHLTGTFTNGTVASSGQTGAVLTTSAITGTLNAGDVITIAGVYGVNRVTKYTTGSLQQFVVTANVASGATSIPIYPALVPTSGAAGAQVQYGTVTVSPASGAAISLVNVAGETYRTNLMFVPEAFTMVTADLEMPKGVHEAARETYKGVSMRMVSQYSILTDQFITRLDVLCGMALLRPEWVVRLGDAL